MAGAKEQSPERMGVWSRRKCYRGAMRERQHVEDDQACETKSSGKDPNSPAAFGVVSVSFLIHSYWFGRHRQDFAFQQETFRSNQSIWPQLKDGDIHPFRNR